MKTKYFISAILSLALFGISSLADTESNDECVSSNSVFELEGVSSHKIAIFKGETRSKGIQPGTNKPDYDKDYFDFTPAVDGIVKVSFRSTGTTNFFIGVPFCNRWNVERDFISSSNIVFYAKANERVNFLAMCRHPRNYQAKIEFIPASENQNDKPKISVNKSIASEGDDGVLKDMIFTLTLDKPSSSYVGVEFKTYDIGARAKEDYEPVDKRVIFAPGEIKKEVKVPIIGDDEKESDEAFEVRLQNPLNAVLAVKSSVGLIKDDDSGYVIPASFDVEPNSDCQNSEVIEELDGIDKSIKFKAKGVVDPTYEDDGEEGRDYYHFTPAKDGNVTIEISSNRPTWFTIGTNGCSSPWEGDKFWNIQRGTTSSVYKNFFVKKGKRVDILALSYDKKQYSLKVEFNPLSKEDIKRDNLENFIKRLYKKVLNRDYDKEGLKFWEERLKDGNSTADDLARYFFDSEEFKSQNLSDTEFLKRVYETILGRSPDSEGYSFWLKELAYGKVDRSKLVDMFIDSPEFREIAAKYGIKANRLH